MRDGCISDDHGRDNYYISDDHISDDRVSDDHMSDGCQ